MTMRPTDASSGRFRRKVVALVGAGCLAGAGILVLAPRAAHATASGDCPIAGSPDSDCFSGSSFNISATAGASTGVINVGQVSDSDGSAASSDLSAAIQWGDGLTDTAQVDNLGDITAGPHTYASPGLYGVTIDVTDSDEPVGPLDDLGTGTTMLSDGIAFVADLAGTSNSVSIAEGTATGPFVAANFTDADGSCSAADSSGLELSAMINWGDGASTPGTVACTSDSGGTVSGAHTYADEGTGSITVDMSDSDQPARALPSSNSGNAELTGGTFTATDATITPGGISRNAVEGSGLSGSLGIITDNAGPSADPLDYSDARTCYNDTAPGGAPNAAGDPASDCVGASLTPVLNLPGEFTVNGSHTFQEEGNFVIQTFITDGENVPGPTQTATMNTPVTVADAPLTVTPVSTIQAKKGQTFKKVVANFKDSDPLGTTSDYVAVINWNDSTPTSLGTITPNGTGGWSVTGTHKYVSSGGHGVTITVYDDAVPNSFTVTQVRVK